MKWTLSFWLAFLIILNYVVPFTLLKDVHSLTGAFLFWSLLTLLVALTSFYMIKRWGRK
jgi:hypothetical protein